MIKENLDALDEVLADAAFRALVDRHAQAIAEIIKLRHDLRRVQDNRG